MVKDNKSRGLSVCLLSPHPLVLGEFERMLSKTNFKVMVRLLEQPLATTDLSKTDLPHADVFLVDAHAVRPTTNTLIAGILDRFPATKLIVVCEKFTDATSHALLRMGAKGLLTYTEALEQLPRALPLVAAGGFWVPRRFCPRLSIRF